MDTVYLKIGQGHYRRISATEANIAAVEAEVFTPLTIGLFRIRKQTDKTHIRRTAPYSNSRMSLKGVHIVRKPSRSPGLKAKPKEKQNKK